ncbi:NAC domain-containing protein [Canna indica]|uniref:NAC domain-containing protein n=1 Tax=Canna indica TaxID=4628 RepID=A0AAQ3JMP3_9LILI|nr:NAC domain-containing protein [Canna indica]
MNAVVNSSASPPIPEAALLAPGFRFRPTDEELVSYYLKRRVIGRPLRVDAIGEVDLYKFEPCELPGLSLLRSRDLEWYFFSPLDRKYASRSRTNRATAHGYWKTTGKDRPVCCGGRVVGMKKTLVYHSGRAPHGTRTNWIMHEYRLLDEKLAKSGVPQDAYVVCRIFQKSGAGPQNGAQYGAPFVEEEWDDVDEKAADALPIISDGAHEKINYIHDEDYLEVDDILQRQDMNDQQERAAKLVDNVGPGDDDCSGDPTIFLDEILKDSSFVDDVVDCIHRSELQSSTSLANEKGEQILWKELNFPSQVDECIEINELQDAENMDHHSNEDFVYSLGASHYLNFADGGGSGSLQELEAEFFDATDLIPDRQNMLVVPPVAEINDQQDAGNMDHHSTEDFVYSWGLSDSLNFVGDWSDNLQELEAEFFDATDVTPDKQKLLLLPSVENNINEPVDSLNCLTNGCGSHQQTQGITNSSILDPLTSEFGNDFLMYFDALENDSQYDYIGFPESLQHGSPSSFSDYAATRGSEETEDNPLEEEFALMMTCDEPDEEFDLEIATIRELMAIQSASEEEPYCPKWDSSEESEPNSKVDGGNDPTSRATPQLPTTNVGGSASSILLVSDNQLKNKDQNIPVMPGADCTVSADSNKANRSRLVNMLDISAPPAFASEFPPSLGKYGQISGTYQAGRLHVSSGLIHLHDLAVASNAEDWSLHKKGTADLLLSYSIAENTGRESAGFRPFRKIQDWTASLLLRGGCYQFFLSTLVLTVGYKVGMCIYGK